MKRALSVVALGLVVSACGPAKPAETSASAPESSAPPPAPRPAPTAVTAAPPPAMTATTKANDEPDEPASVVPYKIGVTINPAAATTKEDVKITWSIDGGPRAKSVKPYVRVKVEWIEIRKPGAKAVAPTVQTFPAVANICTGSPADNVTFPMQAKKNAAVTVEIVACQRGNPLEASKATASTSLAWVSPYVATLDVPTILTAGAPAQGKVEFRGIDGPKAEGAPPKVWVTSNNPGVTITKQPKVEASSTFEIAVKPDVSGDVKLTAYHVNTDGQGKLLGTNTKATTVRVRPKP